MPIGNKIHSQNDSELSQNKTQQTRSPKIDFDLSDPRYSFSDVILPKSTLARIESLVSLKTDFDIVFNEMGFSETHRYSGKFIANFYGPPGTGKTITAHAIANKFGKKLLHVDYSQIESKYVGDTPKNLKHLFEVANNNDCLMFFDEADAILSRRVTNMSNATDTSVNQTRSVLLNILNEHRGDIIFATNFITNYDPAFMRRISMHVCFDLPDESARRLLLQKYIPSRFHSRLNFSRLALESSDLSAADIEKACLMAAFAAAKNGRKNISFEDLLEQFVAVMEANSANNIKKEDASFIKTRIISDNLVRQQLEGHSV